MHLCTPSQTMFRSFASRPSQEAFESLLIGAERRVEIADGANDRELEVIVRHVAHNVNKCVASACKHVVGGHHVGVTVRQQLHGARPLTKLAKRAIGSARYTHLYKMCAK
jgi:hypothetical protein